MLTNFLTVGNQVIILFVLMLSGYIANKKNIIKKETIPGLTNLVLYFVTPCVIINSFIRKFDESMLSGLGITALFAFVIHLINIILALLFIRNKDKSRERVLRFGSIFSNCGYMALPLQQAILGDDGVFFGAVYISVFNFICWSYGIILMSNETSNMSIKKIIFNPGVIGIVIGLIVFIFSIPVPSVIAQPIEYMASLNTPLAMIIVGYQLANTNLLRIFKDTSLYMAVVLRIIIIPVITIIMLSLINIEKTVLVTAVIAASAPTAAITSMFAIKYRQDIDLSVSMISLSTILSLITMPLLVGLAQTIPG